MHAYRQLQTGAYWDARAQTNWWGWFDVVLLDVLYGQSPDQSVARTANGGTYTGDLRFSSARVRQVPSELL